MCELIKMQIYSNLQRRLSLNWRPVFPTYREMLLHWQVTAEAILRQVSFRNWSRCLFKYFVQFLDHIFSSSCFFRGQRLVLVYVKYVTVIIVTEIELQTATRVISPHTSAVVRTLATVGFRRHIWTVLKLTLFASKICFTLQRKS